MKVSRILMFLVCVIISLAAYAVTIDEIITLSKNKIGDDVIISKIKSDNSVFQLSTDDILRLRKEGVSDNVIQFMITTASSNQQNQQQNQQPNQQQGAVQQATPADPNAMGKLLITLTVDPTFSKEYDSIQGSIMGNPFGFNFYWGENENDKTIPFQNILNDCRYADYCMHAWANTYTASDNLKPGKYNYSSVRAFIGFPKFEVWGFSGPFEIKANETTSVNFILRFQKKGIFSGNSQIICTSHPRP